MSTISCDRCLASVEEGDVVLVGDRTVCPSCARILRYAEAMCDKEVDQVILTDEGGVCLDCWEKTDEG